MRRALVAVLLAGVALLLAAPAASAHAVLRSSDPASGASLSKPPQKVTLTFTEPPDLTLSSVHVLDSSGKAVESGKARAVPGNQLALEVPLGQLGNGAYTVSWRTVSRADGHLTNGSFAFGVGVQASGSQGGGTAATAASPPPSVLGVAGRWALDWGLILIVGAVASSLLVFRRRATAPPLPLLGGALALAAAGLLAMIFAERSRVGVSLGALLGTSTGAKLVNQAVVLAITALVLGAVWRWPRRTELLGLLGVGAAATMLVHVAGGHASGERSLTGLNILVQWAHLLAVGVWVGGFLWLLLGLRSRGAPGSRPEPGGGNGLVASMRLEHVHAGSGQPRTPAAGATPVPAGAGATAGNGGSPAVDGRSPAAGGATPAVATASAILPGADDRVDVVQRFSRMATVTLGVVLLTGLIRGLVEVRSWHGLVSTSFGRTLLIKLALVAGLVAIGAVNRFRIVPALRAGRAKVATIGSTVRAELALAIPIVVAAAVLGELPPAQYVSQPAPARQQAPAGVTVSGNDFATSVKLQLTVSPGTVGPNQFSARVVDYDSGQPIDAQQVSLRFALPNRPDVAASSLELKPAADGRFQGNGILAIAGRWIITALVESPGGSVTVPLELQARASPGNSSQVKVSKAPGQPTVYTIALQRGGSLQAYLDPGKPGANVLHLTYFKAKGTEQPMFEVSARGTNPAGVSDDLTLAKFSAGHFVSNLTITPGRWSFSVTATSQEGDLTNAQFEQVIQQ